MFVAGSACAYLPGQTGGVELGGKGDEPSVKKRSFVGCARDGRIDILRLPWREFCLSSLIEDRSLSEPVEY